MPHYFLLNNEIVTFSIKAADRIGKFKPLPAEDEFHVDNSDPDSVCATIGTDHAGGPALIVNSLVISSSEMISLKVSDKAGLPSLTLTVDVIEPAPQEVLDLDMLNIRTVPQASPAPRTPPAADPLPGPEAEPAPPVEPTPEPAAVEEAPPVA